MSYSPSQNLYGIGIGSGPNSAQIVEPRDPNSSDINYKILQKWLNSVSGTLWILTDFSASNGVITANWSPIGGGEIFDEATADSGTAVPSDGNLNFLGGSGVSTSATGSTITFSLTGGSSAIDSFIPDAGTSPVVPDGDGAVAMTGGNGIVTTGGTNELTFAMQSPFTGDFTFTDATAGNSEIFTISNTDNTNGASSAVSLISTGGASGGDPFQTFTVTGAQSWSHGIDNSDSDSFKISASTALGTSDVLSITTSGLTTFPLNDVTITRSDIGGEVISSIVNSDNTDAGSDAISRISVGGDSAGSPMQVFTVTGTTNWTHGIDNGDSDKYKISQSDGGLSTNPRISIYPTGEIAFGYTSNVGTNDFYTFNANVSSGPLGFQFHIQNNHATAGTGVIIGTAPGSTGDAVIQYFPRQVAQWTVGSDTSETAAYKISQGSALGTNDSLVITQSGQVTKPRQTVFLASGSAQSNVTGGGANYTVQFTTPTTNIGDAFDGTSTFTAPVDGLYFFYAYISFTGGISSSCTDLFMSISNVSRVWQGPPAAITPSGGEAIIGGAGLAYLTASQTVFVSIVGTGGSNTISLSSVSLRFGGHLVC